MAAELITLCLAAFAAGFIDAIVGGGGLVQTPATLVTLSQHPVATLLGTLKIPSFAGTSIAAWQYAKKVSLHGKSLFIMCSISFVAAFAGSSIVSVVSNTYMKPIIFFILIAVALYSLFNKNFGTVTRDNNPKKNEWLITAAFALVIGFYDGFIGPGTGSFLVLFFISYLQFDFLKASAHAKFVNLSTNAGSIIFFAGSRHILFQYAIPMALCNIAGSILGSRLAILKGNQFIRVFFLLVIFATILRFGYDLFIAH